MKIIVGLGNPGEKYAKVRHNLGFSTLDAYAQKHLESGFKWQENKKFKSEILKVGQELWLVKPQTYMNNSGMAVVALMEYFKFSPEDLIIVYDDLDLPLGKIKVRLGGAAAGHHGVESIMKAIDSDQFIRVRLGIGNLRTKGSEKKQVHIDTNKFVLEPFLHGEKAQVKHMLKQAISAIQTILDDGVDYAQNQHN